MMKKHYLILNILAVAASTAGYYYFASRTPTSTGGETFAAVKIDQKANLSETTAVTIKSDESSSETSTWPETLMVGQQLEKKNEAQNKSKEQSTDATAAPAITPEQIEQARLETNLSPRNYEFPEVTQWGDGSYTIAIPQGAPLPNQAGTKLLKQAEPSPDQPANRISAAGDLVKIKYAMYKWSTGELVESSDQQLNGQPLRITAGYHVPRKFSANNLQKAHGLEQGAFADYMAKTNDTRNVQPHPNANGVVPEYLSEAVIGSRTGERYQVVFQAGMADLPSQFDRQDGYVLVVDVLDVGGT